MGGVKDEHDPLTLPVRTIRQEWQDGNRRTLPVLPTGCHAAGQKPLMADGTARDFGEIHVGDLLMGMDGTPYSTGQKAAVCITRCALKRENPLKWDG